MKRGIIAILIALIFLLLNCSNANISLVDSAQLATISIVLRFPDETKVIPPETTYFEVALQREGEKSWVTKGFSKQSGQVQTVSFSVVPGTYRIDACAKGKNELGKPSFLAFGTTNVTVGPNETVTATITLNPIYYDFNETRTQATSTETITLSFTAKVPSPFVSDFQRSAIWLSGSLASAVTGYVSFDLSIAGTEIIDGVEYRLLKFTSKAFTIPSVSATTTYTWQSYLYLNTEKWLEYVHYSPVRYLEVMPGSGVIVVIQ